MEELFFLSHCSQRFPFSDLRIINRPRTKGLNLCFCRHCIWERLAVVWTARPQPSVDTRNTSVRIPYFPDEEVGGPSLLFGHLSPLALLADQFS